MAAIAGLICNDAKKEIVKEMLNKIRHRGPDNVNIHQSKSFCCGVSASNLSIKRVNGFAVDGNISVAFDGDIYNERIEKNRMPR